MSDVSERRYWVRRVSLVVGIVLLVAGIILRSTAANPSGVWDYVIVVGVALAGWPLVQMWMDRQARQ